MSALPVILPQGLPASVGALMTTRHGGVSQSPFDSLNLRANALRGDGAADDAQALRDNQRRLQAATDGVAVQWLRQVHGCAVVRLTPQSLADSVTSGRHATADASFSTAHGVACAVLVADCLPVLLAHVDGRVVGAVHAGWRGLAGGVIESAIQAMCDAADCRPADLAAWLGPCIGPAAFEVGADVRDAFGCASYHRFVPGPHPDRWFADLPGLARDRLERFGLPRVSGGTWCTVTDPRFFSYRRDRVTGRQAALIWRRANHPQS